MLNSENQAAPCSACGHSENDHDGYGGMCDGLGFNESRTVCGCPEYRPTAPTPSGGASAAALTADAPLRALRNYLITGICQDDAARIGQACEKADRMLDEIRAALLAARRGEHAARDALLAIRSTEPASDTFTGAAGAILRMKNIARAALAATPEKKDATP